MNSRGVVEGAVRGSRTQAEMTRAFSYVTTLHYPRVCYGALRTLRDVGAVHAKGDMPEYQALVSLGLAECVIARGFTVFRLSAAGKERVS